MPHLPENDGDHGRWRRRTLPTGVLETMLLGQKDYRAKPAHYFLPADGPYSVCGTKANDERMEDVDVPPTVAQRRRCIAEGDLICNHCVRLRFPDPATWACNHSSHSAEPETLRLGRWNCAGLLEHLDQLGSTPLSLRPVGAMPSLTRGPFSADLILLVDTRSPAEGNPLHGTPADRFFPHLHDLRRIHRARTVDVLDVRAPAAATIPTVTAAGRSRLTA